VILNQRLCFLSLKAGQPKWDLMGLDGIEKLPAIQWKLTNIQKIGEEKRAELLAKLTRTLGL